MRTRNIKPGVFKNELLGAADPLATLLFVGLWCIADRDGRLEDRPARIKAELFPYRNVDIDGLMGALSQMRDDEGVPFIVRYQVGGKRLVQISKFQEHQNPHPKEASLGLPEPAAVKLHGEPCKDRDEPGYSFLHSFPSSSNTCPDKPGTVAKDESKANDKHTSPAKDKAAPRKPDELFDAVAQVTASDPKVSGSHIGRICKALRSADPPYTPAEVRQFAAMVPGNFAWHKGQLTLGMVEKYIGIVRVKKEKPGQSEADMIAESKARLEKEARDRAEAQSSAGIKLGSRLFGEGT